MSATLIGVGRLGQEPKMDFTPNGTARTILSLAFRSGFGDKEVTTWMRAVSFGKQAEILNERLSKGDRVKVVAEFQGVKTYEKSDGSTGVSTEIRIMDFEFLDKSSSSGSNEPEEF